MSKGDCYEAALQLMIEHRFDPEWDEAELCHGVPTGQEDTPIAGVRFGHAWVELNGAVFDHSNDRELVMSVGRYYALGQIDDDEVTRYSRRVAFMLAVENEHYGPWEDYLWELSGESPPAP